MHREGVVLNAEEGGRFGCRPGVVLIADPGVAKNAEGGSLSSAMREPPMPPVMPSTSMVCSRPWPTSDITVIRMSSPGCATVAAMRQDPAFKDIFAYRFMVEELMRWFVGDLHGGRELVDALDFSLLLRVIYTMALLADDLRRDNAAALLAGLCNPTLEHVPAQAAALRARLDAPELRPLLETVLAWVQHVAERDLGFDLGIDDMAEVDRLHESGELEEFFATRRRAYQDRYRAEGVVRGIEQGLAAERELLRRQAARKFGAGTAGRLARLLAGVGDADQLAQAGDWIIDCATGEELIARFGNGSPRRS